MTGRRITAGVAAVLLATVGLLVDATGAAQAAKPKGHTCFGMKATIVGNNKNNTIHGTKGDDVIVGLGGNDTIYGAGGNDVICGGYGADRLYGNSGNDYLSGGPGRKVNGRIVNDFLEGGAGNDVLSPGYDGRLPNRDHDQISFAASKRPVHIDANTHQATGHGRDRWLGDNAEIIGSKHGDVFIGGPLTDVFQGGGGADKMYGNGGDDVLRDDYAGTGANGRDLLDGGPGNDRLYTYGGFDTLLGGEGNDLLSDYGYYAGSMQGGPGDDVINDNITANPRQVDDGGPGNDKLNVYVNVKKRHWPRLAVNLIKGTATFKSKKRVTFRLSGTEAVYAHDVPLTFVGDASDNLVWTDGTGDLDAWGNGGADTLIGSYANDDFDGGPGHDRVIAGAGKNRCTSIEELISGRCAG